MKMNTISINYSYLFHRSVNRQLFAPIICIRERLRIGVAGVRVPIFDVYVIQCVSVLPL